MIFDWPLYFAQLAEEITWQRGRQAVRVAQLEAEWPVFRNISYLLSTTPLLVNQTWHQQHQENIRRYLSILEKVIRLCVEHPELSEYLGHSDTERHFVLTPLCTERYITICRLDGYVDRNSGNLKLLEHNSDSPAGILFSPRLNALVRKLWRELGQIPLEQYLAAQQFDNPAQTQALFASFMNGSGAEFAILQEAGKSNVESREMAQAFTASGLPTRVLDPQQLQSNGVRVCAEDIPIDVIWNKINTVYWRQYVQYHPDQADKWLKILHDGKLCHLNHFGARLVTENKRCLSLLQEECFAHFFTAEEHSLIRQMLPWASKFEPGKKVQWQGESLDLVTLARQERSNFVIKEPYDIRGDGVTVGCDCSAEEWEQKIAQALGEGFVLQEYIAPLQLPICNVKHWSPVQTCNLSLDTFLFAGQVAGYGAKASIRHRVNLFKGGQKLAVLVGA